MGPIGGFGLTSEYSRKQEKELFSHETSIEDKDFDPKPYAIKATIAFVLYMLASNIAYYFTNNFFENTEKGQNLIKQYKKAWIDNKCDIMKGELESMPVNGLFACSYVCFGYGAYIFTLYRLKILKGTSMPI